jgi:hypothetical protein
MGAAPPLVQLAANHPVDAARLSHEFRRLAKYVAGIQATDYQVGKYVDFHRRRGRVTADPTLEDCFCVLARPTSFGLARSDGNQHAVFTCLAATT